MIMEWNSRKSTRCVWATLATTTFALCVLIVFIVLNLGTKYRSITQGSSDHVPHSEKLMEEECIPVCDSEGCVLQSKTLLEYLQPTSNPCDNFNKFACGSLAGKFPDMGGSAVIRLNKHMRIKFKNILENLDPSPGSASDKMKIVYDSCINPDSETEAVPTLQKILETLGIKDWPHLTPDFKFKDITLASVIANLLLHDEKGFVSLSREDDGEQSEIPNTLKVTSYQQADNLMPMPPPSSEARKLEIDSILKYFDLDPETLMEIQEEREAMRTQIEYLKMESRGITSHSNSFVNCSRDTKQWADLCEVINAFLAIAELNGEVSNRDVFLGSGEIHYLQNIFPLLRNFSDRAVANYIAIDIILNHQNDLNLYFRLAHINGANEALKLFDMVSPIDRWQSCVDWISKGMTYALMYEYGKKEFTLDMLIELSNMTDALIHEVAEYYSHQEWIPESIRREKTAELRKYKLNSPSMKHYPTDTAVNEFYERFNPKNGNFLNNVMEFRRFKTVEKMRRKIDTFILENNIFKADAFGGGGSTDVGLTLLQPPYFSTKRQRMFNLASLGFTIVHELGHSIFDRRDFVLEHLQKMVQCIGGQVSQYQFELLGKNLNGQQYMWEDLADNVAVSIIDKVIDRYLSVGVENFLPGLPFPTQQLLYIDSALFFCSVSWKSKEELYSQGTHSPDDVRIYQRVRNSKLFSEVFNCPVGSFMNPADKCHVFTEGRSE